MDRAKILDKIQKCMNLSASSNEHEAAAAMRQAQKLMERHGVTEQELGTVGYTSELVEVPIQAGKKVPLHLAKLINLVMRAFGVKAVLGRNVRISDPSFNVTYFGPEHRVALATYSHIVVFRAVNRAWDKYLAEHPELKGERGARMGFMMGWLEAVEVTVMEFAMTPEELSATNALVQQVYGRELVKSKANRMRLDNEALSAGVQGGRDFSLHRPVNGSASQRLAIGN